MHSAINTDINTTSTKRRRLEKQKASTDVEMLQRLWCLAPFPYSTLTDLLVLRCTSHSFMRPFNVCILMKMVQCLFGTALPQTLSHGGTFMHKLRRDCRDVWNKLDDSRVTALGEPEWAKCAGAWWQQQRRAQSPTPTNMPEPEMVVFDDDVPTQAGAPAPQATPRPSLLMALALDEPAAIPARVVLGNPRHQRVYKPRTVEQKERRRLRIQQQRAASTPEELAAQRAKRNARDQKRRAAYSPEQWAAYIAKKREWKVKNRAHSRGPARAMPMPAPAPVQPMDLTNDEEDEDYSIPAVCKRLVVGSQL